MIAVLGMPGGGTTLCVELLEEAGATIVEDRQRIKGIEYPVREHSKFRKLCIKKDIDGLNNFFAQYDQNCAVKWPGFAIMRHHAKKLNCRICHVQRPLAECSNRYIQNSNPKNDDELAKSLTTLVRHYHMLKEFLNKRKPDFTYNHSSSLSFGEQSSSLSFGEQSSSLSFGEQSSSLRSEKRSDGINHRDFIIQKIKREFNLSTTQL